MADPPTQDMLGVQFSADAPVVDSTTLVSDDIQIPTEQDEVTFDPDEHNSLQTFDTESKKPDFALRGMARRNTFAGSRASGHAQLDRRFSHPLLETEMTRDNVSGDGMSSRDDEVETAVRIPEGLEHLVTLAEPGLGVDVLVPHIPQRLGAWGSARDAEDGSERDLETLIAEEVQWLSKCREQASFADLHRRASLEHPSSTNPPSAAAPPSAGDEQQQQLSEAEEELASLNRRLALVRSHEAALCSQVFQAEVLSSLGAEAASLQQRIRRLEQRVGRLRSTNPVQAPAALKTSLHEREDRARCLGPILGRLRLRTAALSAHAASLASALSSTHGVAMRTAGDDGEVVPPEDIDELRTPHPASARRHLAKLHQVSAELEHTRNEMEMLSQREKLPPPQLDA